jgi:hypothetical protein
MHLITQPIHVLPCSNLAMMADNGTNRILYHDIVARTITEPTPCFIVGTRNAFRIVGSLGCPPNINSSWCKEQREGRLISPSLARFLLSDIHVFLVLTPPFTHLIITLSNHRLSGCSPTVDVGFVKVTSDSFCGNRVFKMNIQFCCHVYCSNSVIF